MQRVIMAAAMVMLFAGGGALAAPDLERASPAAKAGGAGEKMAALPHAGAASGGAASDGGEEGGSSVCALIDAAAAGSGLPSAFFTRLIWTESRFRTTAVSPKGAQGIAQFMPATAAERGLADPFDAHQAIPASARLLKELAERFGNVGLAAAAYNAGARRVADWLSGTGGMPRETRAYVAAITGLSVEQWRDAQAAAAKDKTDDGNAALCRDVVAGLTDPAALGGSAGEIATAAQPVVERQPWGVQLAGSFSEERALSSYRSLQQRHPQVLGGREPLILRKRNASRGRKAMVNVRVPAPTRTAADDLCHRLRSRGSACIVLKN